MRSPPLGKKQMSWLSGFSGDRQLEALGERPRLALGHMAERKRQEVGCSGSCEQEVALVTAGSAARCNSGRPRPRRRCT